MWTELRQSQVQGLIMTVASLRNAGTMTQRSTGIPCFYCAWLVLWGFQFSSFFLKYKWKVHDNPASTKSISTIFFQQHMFTSCLHVTFQ